MGNGRLARGTRQCPVLPIQANPDQRGLSGVARHSGQLCLAPHVLARWLCRSRPHLCRSNRILRTGSAAVAHAVEPALNRTDTDSRAFALLLEHGVCFEQTAQ